MSYVIGFLIGFIVGFCVGIISFIAWLMTSKTRKKAKGGDKKCN